MLLPALDWHPQPRLEPLHLDWLARAGVEVAVLRLDRIDPLISGNKWFKLVHHLRAAHEAGAEGVMRPGRGLFQPFACVGGGGQALRVSHGGAVAWSAPGHADGARPESVWHGPALVGVWRVPRATRAGFLGAVADPLSTFASGARGRFRITRRTRLPGMGSQCP